MFVHKQKQLPPDTVYPNTLEELGFILTPAGKLLNADKPSEGFRFHISTSFRENEVRREALHHCIRQEVLLRLKSLGLDVVNLPRLSTEKPQPNEPYLPIVCTPLKLLKEKRRIVVIVNSSLEDLGIWSWRVIAKAGGIKSGSVLDFVSDVQTRAYKRADELGLDRESETPGIVVLNPGQLLFSHKLDSAVSQTTWMANPRDSAVHAPPKVHEAYNRIRSNKTASQHVKYVFKNILGRNMFPEWKPELYIVGVADGADTVVEHLASKPHSFAVAALAVTAPVPVSPTTSRIQLTEENRPLMDLLQKRAKAWCLSNLPLGAPLANATPVDDQLKAASEDSIKRGSRESMQEIAPFPMVSGGESQLGECIISSSARAILDWFDEVHAVGGALHYRNSRLDVDEEQEKLTLGINEHSQLSWNDAEASA